LNHLTNYIGIDPSTKTGFVVLDQDGEVLDATEITTKEKDDLQRFIDLSTKVRENIELHDKVVIEGFSYNSRGRSVSTQYGLGWIMRYELYDAMIDYIEVPPTTVKKFATGKGNAAKDVVMREVYKRWGFENDSNNICDAYVMAQIARALDNKGKYTKAQLGCLKGLI